MSKSLLAASDISLLVINNAQRCFAKLLIDAALAKPDAQADGRSTLLALRVLLMW